MLKIWKNKGLQYVVVLVLSITLFAISILNLLLPDVDISFSERRSLDQFPEFTLDRLLNGEFANDFEDYLLDQFAYRDFFRKLKITTELNIFNKLDVNDIYMFDGHLIKLTKPYSQDSVIHFTDYIQQVYDMYLTDHDVYLSVIPDKNYFVDHTSYPSLNYEDMIDKIVDNLDQIHYIDLFDQLTLDDYYTTDTHWKQEQLLDIVQLLSDEMGLTIDVHGIDYEAVSFEGFYGVYYGQAGLNIEGDRLTYLISDAMKDVTIINYEYLDQEDLSVYDSDQLLAMDPYNVFLSGPSPLIVVEKNEESTGKELILFRDSFASALSPLLLDAYDKITIIDTRYVSYEYLGQFVDFDSDADVLFMYNTEVINSSQMLK